MSLEFRLLKQFNDKFLIWLNEVINFAPPNIKEVKLLPTAIDFVINHGDPTKIITMFYENMHIYADRFYQEEPDRSLLEEGFIINQLTKALVRNKNKLKDDKFEMLNDHLNNDNNFIKDHVIYARDYWDSKSKESQMKLWTDSQILLKLSEKYAELINNKCTNCECSCVN